jgi:hypothetical protein
MFLNYFDSFMILTYQWYKWHVKINQTKIMCDTTRHVNVQSVYPHQCECELVPECGLG